jgi:hypothetical protein
MLIAKNYLFELKCCDQDYDLLQMSSGSAKIVVSDFQQMVFHNVPQEMVNTGVVTILIEGRPDLKNNPYLNSILKKIDKEERRIMNNLKDTRKKIKRSKRNN